jgi:5-methylcytosine-specific restriction protein A
MARHGKNPRSTLRWRRLRRLLLKVYPFCVDPFFVHCYDGRMVPATEVDHRVRVIDAPELAFEMSNLQALCKECHAKRTAQERRQARPGNG